MERTLLERYFRAMQRGPEGEEELIALFADDAIYVEPFGGRTHFGREAIREWLRSSWADQPPGIRLTVERVDVIEEVVEASWTCESDIFDAPARGRDRFTIRDGKISRLQSELLEQPKLKR
jgi:ketosteroid isomerase-like protein